MSVYSHFYIIVLVYDYYPLLCILCLTQASVWYWWHVI